MWLKHKKKMMNKIVIIGIITLLLLSMVTANTMKETKIKDKTKYNLYEIEETNNITKESKKMYKYEIKSGQNLTAEEVINEHKKNVATT